MIDPAELLTDVVASLRANTELVALLGDAESITAFDLEGPGYRTLAEAIDAMPEGSALVAFMGIQTGHRLDIQRWKHNFSIVFMAPGNLAGDAETVHPGYLGLVKALVDGPSVEAGLRWLDTTINVSCDPPEFSEYTAGVNKAGSTYWLFNFSLIEIGG